MKLVFPRLYVILDAVLLPQSVFSCAQLLAGSGVELLQYRDKQGSSRRLFEVSKELQQWARPLGITVVVNDRPDVAAVTGAGGVHLGQEDLPLEEARRIVGDSCLIGVSTHNQPQVLAADAAPAGYLAIGPVFPTATKENPDPVVGLEFVRQVRRLTRKPLVAIGGITLENVRSVWEAGADCVAVARDVVCASNPGERAAAYLRAASDHSDAFRSRL